MKTLSLCVCFVTVLAISPVRAQEPVVGVADPESLFKSSDPKQILSTVQDELQAALDSDQ